MATLKENATARRKTREANNSVQNTQSKSGTGVSRVGTNQVSTNNSSNTRTFTPTTQNPGGERNRDDRFAATPSSTIDPNRGIRPGQFGQGTAGSQTNTPVYFGNPSQDDIDAGRATISHYNTSFAPGSGGIDEGAGQFVRFERDPVTGRDVPILMQNDQELGRFGAVDNPTSRTNQTRRDPGAPLQDPNSGVRGPGTGLGINPQTTSQVSGQPGRFSPNVQSPTERRGITTRSDVERNIAFEQKAIDNIRSTVTPEGVKAKSSDPTFIQEQIDTRFKDYDPRNAGGIFSDGRRVDLIATKEAIDSGRITKARQYISSSDGTILTLSPSDKYHNTGIDPFTGKENDLNWIAADASERKFADYNKLINGEYVTPEDQEALDELSQRGKNMSQLNQQNADILENQRQSELFQQQDAQRTQQGIDQNRKKSIDSGAIESFLSTLPPGSEGMAGMLRNYMSLQDNENAIIGGANDQLRNINKTSDNVQSILGQMSQRENTFASTAKGMLDTTNRNRQELLVQQEKFAVEEINRNKNRLIRQERQRINDEVDTRYASLALSGGFGSSNGLDDVADARASSETALYDLEAEFSAQAKDTRIKYHGLAIQAEENYTKNVLGVLDGLKTGLNAISLQGISNQQTKGTAISNLIQNTTNAVVNERRNLASTYLKATEMIESAKISAKTREDLLKKSMKDDAYKFFNFAFTQSTDPKLRESAIAQMNAAGYELPQGIDINADPIGFQLAAMNNAAKSAENSASNPFRFKGEGAEEKQALAASALTVVGKMKGGVDINGAQLDYVNQLLDRGETEKAKSHLRGLAVGGLNATQGNMYTSRSVIAGRSNELIKELQVIKDTSKGQTLVAGLAEAAKTLGGKSVADLTADDFTTYNKSILTLKKKMGTETDEGLQRIFAKVENIAGLIINERYGAAVTDGEMLRAQEYIPMSGNTLTEMMVKLEEFSSFSKFQNETMLNTQMGLSSDNIDMFAPDVNQSPAIPTDDDFNKMFLPITDSLAPKISGVTESDLVSVKVGARNVRAQPYVASALESADREFFKKTGRHIQVNQDFRSSATQADLFAKSQSGEIGRAAPPGKSFHEKGLALDITNWEEAQPYLEKYGLVNGLKGDMGHFSIGELNPQFIASNF